MGLVVPAVLPFSHEELDEKLEIFARIPSVSRIQIDVVDGKFATPASWPYSTKATKNGLTELEAMARNGEMLPHLDRLEYEVDLMCFDAERDAEAWLALGVSRLVFHAESVTNLLRLITSARKRYGAGGLASFISFGFALNIASDLALIEPYLDKIEFVQFMGIARIGRQGQPLDQHIFEKVRLFHTRHPEIPVQIDGGVSFENVKKLVALGVSNLIMGSAITRSNNPAEDIAAIEELQSSYGV